MSLLFLLKMNADYHDGVFQQIVDATIHNEMTDEQKAVRLTKVAHDLVRPRVALFAGRPYIGHADTVLRNSLHDLNDGRGACGSYHAVLSSLMQKAGLKVETIQMKTATGVWGGHILNQAKIDGRWIPFDASYNLFFRNSDGSLATFDQISSQWAEFAAQTPADYRLDFNYSDYRTTNWSKVPIVMPLMRWTLECCIGEGVNHVSLRQYVLNRDRFVFNCGIALLGAYVVVIFLSSCRRATPSTTSEQDTSRITKA